MGWLLSFRIWLKATKKSQENHEWWGVTLSGRFTPFNHSNPHHKRQNCEGLSIAAWGLRFRHNGYVTAVLYLHYSQRVDVSVGQKKTAEFFFKTGIWPNQKNA